MALKPLDPAVKQPLTDIWELIVLEAGRGADGLKGTVQLWNGSVQDCQTILFGNSEARTRFVHRVAAKIALTPEVLEESILQLGAATEATLRDQEAQGAGRGPSQATTLVELVMRAEVELFRHDDRGYGTVPVDNHMETWLLRTKGFRRWIERQFYLEEGKAPGSQAVQDALGVLEGKALFDGAEVPVHTRLAEYEGSIYLDLANADWQVVEITPTGWQLVATSPVKFRRTRGMMPLPMPVRGGSLDDLRGFVNIAKDNKADWELFVSWLVATFRPTGPYAVLVLHGEHGAAKSTQTHILRQLVDPNAADLRSTPREERDLVIAASNGWIIAFDNLSYLPQWLSDALCRLATGSGFATRELYSDNEEIIFAAQRPIVMNSIEELATRSDLLDRSILLYLPKIEEGDYQDESVFWRKFDEKRPQILAVLLDIVSAALHAFPAVTRNDLPRMADFARWACAAAEACGWSADDFLDAYNINRSLANTLALDASPVVPILRKLMEDHKKATDTPWEGSATELLTVLENLADEATKHSKVWPKAPNRLSGILRRLAPNLYQDGIDVNFGKGKDRKITIRVFNATSPAGDKQNDKQDGEREFVDI